MIEATIVLLVSGYAIYSGHKLFLEGEHLKKYGIKIEANVFSNRKRNFLSSDSVRYPTVRFVTEKNEWVTKELKVGFYPPKELGSKLKVIYDPDDLGNVRLDSFWTLTFLPIVISSIGLLGIASFILDLADVVDFWGI